MAKGKSNGTAAAAEGSASDNGGIIFQKMADDFTIPTVSRGGQWDPVVEQLCAKENKGAVIKVYMAEGHTAEHAQLVYTRAKALKNAAKRLGKELTVAVRILDGKSCLLAASK